MKDNELIAKFMGMTKGHPDPEETRWKDDWFNPSEEGGARHSYLHFDTSWDWLMPVYNKVVEEMSTYWYEKYLPAIQVRDVRWMNIWGKLTWLFMKGADIKEVYLFVVEFIKYQNDVQDN